MFIGTELLGQWIHRETIFLNTARVNHVTLNGNKSHVLLLLYYKTLAFQIYIYILVDCTAMKETI